MLGETDLEKIITLLCSEANDSNWKQPVMRFKIILFIRLDN